MEISEFSSFNNQNYSFENNNTILHNNSFVPEFIKIDDIEDLFKVDNILNYFTNTLINTNTKELNFDKDDKNEIENDNIFDKKFVENIQWKEREKILQKDLLKKKKT